jgi:hypothetical protein
MNKIPVDPKTGVILDKRPLVEAMDALFARLGIEKDSEATHEKLDAMLKEAGIRPEDNLCSRDIIRARYGCEEE